ncbi:MAG: hypothetical protein WAO98_05565 [Alphaproteobacteria bacterium]
MKKLILVTLLAYLSMSHLAYAQEHKKYALGNMYTKALNMMGSCGMLNTLDSKNSVIITNIHMDHGQVLVDVVKAEDSVTIIYDPIANMILSPAK